MQCNDIFLFPRTFEVASIDLVSMVENYEEPLEIILLTCFEIESRVIGLHVYQNNWEPVIGEALKTCMEPHNKVNNYAVAVVDNKKNIIGHLPKGKSGKYAKTIFYFLRSDPLNICAVKITGKAVNLGDNGGMRNTCLLQSGIWKGEGWESRQIHRF